MKRLFLVLSLMLFVLTLTSCGWGKIHQINYFIEGEFIGVDEENNEIEIHLTVLPITKKNFDSSKGVNTVYDVYKNLYYELELVVRSKECDEKMIVLNNLKAFGTPNAYGNGDGKFIVPLISERNPLTNDSIMYIVEISNRNQSSDNHESYFVYLKNKVEIDD